MSNPLAVQSFEYGVRRGLLKAARMTKAAIDPRAVKILVDPLRKRQLAMLGETLFRESRQTASPMAGLKSVVLPGYGQLSSVKHLIASYPSLFRNAAPADRPMVKRLFQQQLQQAFAEIGHVAEPKIKFWNKAVPATLGGAAGLGLGGAAGSISGAMNRQRANEQQIADMPMWDRMKYLLLPQSLNIRPQLPYELRASKDRQVQ